MHRPRCRGPSRPTTTAPTTRARCRRRGRPYGRPPARPAHNPPRSHRRSTPSGTTESSASTGPGPPRPSSGEPGRRPGQGSPAPVTLAAGPAQVEDVPRRHRGGAGDSDRSTLRGESYRCRLRPVPSSSGRPAGFDPAGLRAVSAGSGRAFPRPAPLSATAYPWWCHPAGSSTRAVRAAWVCGDAKRGRGIPNSLPNKTSYADLRGPGAAGPCLRASPACCPRHCRRPRDRRTLRAQEESTSAPDTGRGRPEVAMPRVRQMPGWGPPLSTGLPRYPPQPVDLRDGTARASERGTVMTYPMIHDMESARARTRQRDSCSPSHRHGSSPAILCGSPGRTRSVEQRLQPR